MNIESRFLSSTCLRLVLLLLWGGSIWAAPGLQPPPAPPRVFLLDAQQLQASRARLRKGDKTLAPAIAKLAREAKNAMAAGPFSVVTKQTVPPSGDQHDYMSQSVYWWPDPKSSNGLPYIKRDGECNPEVAKVTDHHALDELADTVETLALAYYFTNDKAAATKAAELLRAWFLDDTTRMNPNLQYAQFIPGVNTGRGFGLIDTVPLTRIIDAIGLLEDAKVLTKADRRGLQKWFEQFLKWMRESKNGREEAAEKNNHGTYYDVQAASFALFLGKKDLAASIIQGARRHRLQTQIEPDGRQPLELARTKSWDYSIMNLEGWLCLAKLGEPVNIDLWHYRTQDGRGLRQVITWLAPFATGEMKWQTKQLTVWEPQILFPLLRQAASHYPDAEFRAWLAKLPAIDAANRETLLIPSTPRQE